MKVRSLARRLRLSHYVESCPGSMLSSFYADELEIWIPYFSSWPVGLMRGAPSSMKGRRRALAGFSARR